MKYLRRLQGITLGAVFVCSLVISNLGLYTVASAAANPNILFSDHFGSMYSINPDGTELTSLGIGNYPQYYSGGTKIVYMAYNASGPCFSGTHGSPGEIDVYTMNLDGTDVTDLTVGDNLCGLNAKSASVSPDGTKLVFDADASSIYTMNIDGTNITELQPRGLNPTWSPDGSRIVFVYGDTIEVMNADGTNLTQLATSALSPSWSPDGTMIAFLNSNINKLMVMNADGSNQRVVYSAPFGGGMEEDRSVGWSPNSSTLAFTLYAPGQEQAYGLYTIPVLGGAPTQVLAGTSGRDVLYLSWSNSSIASTVPAAPTNLTATSPTNQVPVLGWTSAFGATSYNIYRDGTKLGSSATPTYSDSSATEGTNTYYVTAVNDSGESGQSNTVNVLVDKTAPVVTMPSWSANPLQQGQYTTLSTTVSDNLSGVASVQYSVDNGTPQPMAFDANSGTWRANFGSGLAANTYDVTITATDAAGNVSVGTTDVLAVYTTANGYVTGHAKMQPGAGDTMPIALDTSNHPKDLVLGFTNVTAPTSGSFDMDYAVKKKQNEFSISSTNINWVVVSDSTHASILGHGDLTTYVNGVKTVTQNAAVRFDIVLGTNGTADYITIKIFNSGLNPNTDQPTYVISDNDSTNGSNLMIHP